MGKRSDRWTLEPVARPCVHCGTEVQHRINVGSGEALTYPHRAPDGSLCVEHEHQEAVERTRRICEKAGVPW